MSAAAAPSPAPDPEQALDDILNNINKLMKHQCKKAKEHRKRPQGGARKKRTAEQGKRTGMAFQVLRETQLDLAESGEDLHSRVEEKVVSVLRPTTWFPSLKKKRG